MDWFRERKSIPQIMLLIITNKNDLTADFLIARLIEQNKPYFRLNAEDLTQADFSFSIDNGSLRRELGIPTKKVEFSDISCVWYRRKIQVQPRDNVPSEQRRFITGEITHLMEGLILNNDVLWVNPIESVLSAERKVFQLRLARALGFSVPKTLISNVPSEIRQFMDDVTNVICKPIYHGLYLTETERFAIYANRVDKQNFTNDRQIEICPIFLQEEIRKSGDIRATFIGEDVFGVEIRSSEKSLLDWRRPGKELLYNIIRMDNKVEALCRQMLKTLNLQFGAFDFAVAESGEIYFLEVNATGEWAWLERELELPMRDSFIKLFGI